MKIRPTGLLFLAHAATDINQGSVSVLLPFFIAQYGLSYAAAATFVFVMNLVSSAAQPVFGYIADRRTRPWVIPLSMLCAAFGVSFAGIAPTFHLGVAAVALSGLGFAAFHPEGARVLNYVAGDRKAAAMSLFAAGGQVGFVIGPLIATAALIQWGLKGTICLGIPALILAPFVARKVRGLSVQPAPRRDDGTVQEGIRVPDAWGAFFRLSGTLLCRSIIFYGINTFLPLFWIDVLHQSKAAAGSALTFFFVFVIIGNSLGGRIAERRGYRTLVVGSFVLLTFVLPPLVFVKDPLWAMVVLATIGLVLSASFGPLVALGQIYLPNRVGLASGVTMGLAFSFGGLATPLLGWVGDHHGLHAAIGVLACLPIICVGLALTLPDPATMRVSRPARSLLRP